MDTTKPLVNRVAQSALITLDLEEYYPLPEQVVAVDLKDYLFKGLILKEAEFRDAIKQADFTVYTGKYVTLYCSTNAIVPMWAYMILSTQIAPFAKDVVCSPPAQAAEVFLTRNLSRLDTEQFKEKRIVVKGCGDRQIPEAAYVQIATQLAGVARSIMYGEPCSTVPVFKKAVD